MKQVRYKLAIIFLFVSTLQADSFYHGKICASNLLAFNTIGFIGWSQIDGTITPGAGATTPNNTSSARFVEGSALNSDHLIFFEGTSVTPGHAYQYSVFTKAVLTDPNVRLAKMQLASAGYTAEIDGFFDNRAGTIFFITPPSGPDLTSEGSGFIIKVGSGWWKIGYNFVAATSTVNILIGQATSGGNGTYDGDGTSATDYWTPSICPL